MPLRESAAPATTVLLVDDDDDLRFLARRWVAADDRFELVGEASDGAEAIEAARVLRPDLVVMDVAMPRCDGEEAARIIGSLCPAVRVLAHTAHADRRNVLAMIGAGVHGYLVKSGTDEEFLRALTTVADGGTYLSPQVTGMVVEHVRDSVTPDYTIDLLVEPEALRIALQPIVDVRSGKVAGYEALARFAGTEGPGPVFAAATRCGRGIEVELAAATAAIAVTAELRNRVDFIGLNVSPQTASTSAFLSILDDADAMHTVIEITENVEVLDYPQLRGVLQPLRARGYRIAIDDVGAGFSSLTHVHQLAPDLIKIDRYLVEHVDTDTVRQAMVAALVAIADRVGARLVGEGVETPAELAKLAELGVDLVQGYLLGRPELVPAEPAPSTVSP